MPENVTIAADEEEQAPQENGEEEGKKKIPKWLIIGGIAAVILAVLLLRRNGGESADTSGLLAEEMNQRLKEQAESLSGQLTTAGQPPYSETATTPTLTMPEIVITMPPMESYAPASWGSYGSLPYVEPVYVEPSISGQEAATAESQTIVNKSSRTISAEASEYGLQGVKPKGLASPAAQRVLATVMKAGKPAPKVNVSSSSNKRTNPQPRPKVTVVPQKKAVNVIKKQSSRGTARRK